MHYIHTHRHLTIYAHFKLLADLQKAEISVKVMRVIMDKFYAAGLTDEFRTRTIDIGIV